MGSPNKDGSFKESSFKFDFSDMGLIGAVSGLGFLGFLGIVFVIIIGFLCAI